MPQIAQQDYLRIPVYDITSIRESSEEIGAIRKYAEAGLIMDVILEVDVEGEGGEHGKEEIRPLCHDNLNKTVTVYSSAEETMVTIYYGE